MAGHDAGLFARADTKNINGRVYPKSILKREVRRFRQQHIKQGTALGELNHPSYYSNYFRSLNLPNISHQVRALRRLSCAGAAVAMSAQELLQYQPDDVLRLWDLPPMKPAAAAAPSGAGHILAWSGAVGHPGGAANTCRPPALGAVQQGVCWVITCSAC